jgi:flagellum-specific peptidoglycan hydrolase FlgJ
LYEITSILEIGWGISQLATKAFNLFGVKADNSWHGDIYRLQTLEFINGQWILIPAKW